MEVARFLEKGLFASVAGISTERHACVSTVLLRSAHECVQYLCAMMIHLALACLQISELIVASDNVIFYFKNN